MGTRRKTSIVPAMGTTFVDIRRVPMRQEADLLPDRRLGGGWRRNADVSQFNLEPSLSRSRFPASSSCFPSLPILHSPIKITLQHLWQNLLGSSQSGRQNLSRSPPRPPPHPIVSPHQCLSGMSCTHHARLACRDPREHGSCSGAATTLKTAPITPFQRTFRKSSEKNDFVGHTYFPARPPPPSCPSPFSDTAFLFRTTRDATMRSCRLRVLRRLGHRALVLEVLDRRFDGVFCQHAVQPTENGAGNATSSMHVRQTHVKAR